MYHIIYKKSIQESRPEFKTLLPLQKGQDETLNKIYDIYKNNKVSSKEKQYLSSDQLIQLEKADNISGTETQCTYEQHLRFSLDYPCSENKSFSNGNLHK